jgi:hypothetical protein
MRSVPDLSRYLAIKSVQEVRNVLAHGGVGSLAPSVRLLAWLGAPAAVVAEADRLSKDNGGRPFPSFIKAGEVFSGHGAALQRLLTHGVAADGTIAVQGTTSVVSGLAGVGKSALARGFCSQVALRYPAGVLWANAESAASLHTDFLAMAVAHMGLDL